MKKLTAIVLCLLVISFVISTLFISGCAEKEEIQIGVILPLSGNIAWLGEMHKWGIDLAIEEINSQGGIKGRKIELIYEDDQNDPQKAVSAFRKMITTDNPIVIITAMSNSGMAVRPLAEENKIILFANGNHPELVKGNEWVFRIFLTSEQEAEVMAKIAVEDLRLEKVAILYINDASGEGGKSVFEKIYTNLGGKITITEKYDRNSVDFRSEVTKVISTKPDAVYLIGYGNAAGQVLNQLKELGYKEKILGTSNFGGPPISEIAKEAIEGSVFTTPLYDPQVPTLQIEEFITKIKSRSGKTAQWNTAMEYDGIYVIKQALEKTKQINGVSLRNALTEIIEFEGVVGKYKYKSREWLPSVTIKVYKNGKIESYERR